MRAHFALLLLPLMAACGGGGGSTSSGAVSVVTGPTPTPTPTATPTPTGSTSADATALASDPGATAIIFGAGDLSARSTPYEIGVATHFAYASKSGYDAAATTQWMKAANVTAFRDDIFWNDFAPDWDVNGSHLAPAISGFLKQTSARPMFILTNGNPFIPESWPPISAAGRAAFVAFAKRAVAATAGRNAMYEIWNEWNVTAAPDKPMLMTAGEEGDVRAARYYAALASDTVAAIKDSTPDTKVIVGAGGSDPSWDWIADAVARGAAKRADGVSVHLYNQCERTDLRTATAAIARLYQLQTRLASVTGGQTPPIYISEWGWPGGSLSCSVASSVVATSVPQFLLHTAALPWVAGSWIYELKDSGTNANDLEHHFGLYDAAGNAKPALCGFSEAAQIVRNATAMSVQQVGSGLTVVRAATPQGLQVIAWSSLAGRTGRLTVGGTAAYTTRTLCQSATAGTADRTVTVGEMPVVIDVPGVSRLGVNARLL